jgi:hypothetical protein
LTFVALSPIENLSSLYLGAFFAVLDSSKTSFLSHAFNRSQPWHCYNSKATRHRRKSSPSSKYSLNSYFDCMGSLASNTHTLYRTNIWKQLRLTVLPASSRLACSPMLQSRSAKTTALKPTQQSFHLSLHGLPNNATVLLWSIGQFASKIQLQPSTIFLTD